MNECCSIGNKLFYYFWYFTTFLERERERVKARGWDVLLGKIHELLINFQTKENLWSSAVFYLCGKKAKVWREKFFQVNLVMQIIKSIPFMIAVEINATDNLHRHLEIKMKLIDNWIDSLPFHYARLLNKFHSTWLYPINELQLLNIYIWSH